MKVLTDVPFVQMRVLFLVASFFTWGLQIGPFLEPA